MSSTVSNSLSQIYVTDTSALIEDPTLFSKLTGRIVIPLSVIKQLDLQKNSADEFIARTSRQVTRYLDDISASGNIVTGIRINNRATVSMLNSYDTVDTLDSVADNRIVGTAKRLTRESVGQHIVLLTTDRNMRIAARSLGIDAGFSEYMIIEKPVIKRTKPTIAPVDWYDEFSKAFIGAVKFVGAAIFFYPLFAIIAIASQVK